MRHMIRNSTSEMCDCAVGVFHVVVIRKAGTMPDVSVAQPNIATSTETRGVISDNSEERSKEEKEEE